MLLGGKVFGSLQFLCILTPPVIFQSVRILELKIQIKRKPHKSRCAPIESFIKITRRVDTLLQIN